MERDRKSERNQQIYEQLKFERKQRGRTRPKMPAPRFALHVVTPEVSEGMELHKFFGEPTLLPARVEGEPLVGKSPYTQRQLDVLDGLVEQRNYELFIKPEEDAIKEASSLGTY